jgi:lantibiotic biosynthesis dehydratase-like protein
VTGHTARSDSGWAFWRPAVLRAPGFDSRRGTNLCSPLAAEAADRLSAEALANRADPDWLAYQGTFAAEAARLGTVLGQIAREPRFQFALAWQNHQVIEKGVEPMLRRAEAAGSRNTKQRQREDMVANYWQRYCLKNDTIGFFGPIAWGFFDDSVPHTQLAAGPGLIANSETFFEQWAIDVLIDVLAEQPGMTDWIPPALVPFVRLDGDQVIRPAGPPIKLAPTELAVVRLVDGCTPAVRIAAALGPEVLGPDAVSPDVLSAHALSPEALGPDARISRDEVFEILASLRRRRVLTWKLQLPLSAYPELGLRRYLASVGDAGLAASGIAKLDQLEAAKRVVSQAAQGDDPALFTRALSELDEVFIGLTGTAPNRNGGKAYGGRTLVYHDARRNLDFTLGADFAAALEPLDLLLQSARWLTHEFRAALDVKFTAIAERLAAADGWPISLASFWFECLPLLHKSAYGLLDDLQVELQRRWAGLVPWQPDQARVQLSLAELREPVREAFDAPDSGWAGGRYVSPDVLIAAADAEAMHRGDFELILGELHLALPSLRHSCFVSQHPNRGDLLAYLAEDNPGPRLMSVAPKEDAGRLTIRTQPALTRDEDFVVALFEQTADPSRPRLLRAADLFVAQTADGLRVTVGTDCSFDIADVFSELLTQLIMDRFVMFPPSAHRPRISIDRLVIARETWQFPANQFDFTATSDEAVRFAGARAWWRRQSLPEQVFVKVPGETKPFFVDFTSPLYVNILAKAVRRLQAGRPGQSASARQPASAREPASAGGQPAASTPGPEAMPMVQISEMLPSMADLWLSDQEGNRYTSECRVVAVDLRGPVPGGTRATTAAASRG